MQVDVDVRTLSNRLGGISYYTYSLWMTFCKLSQEIPVRFFSHNKALPDFPLKDVIKKRLPQRWGGERIWEEWLFPRLAHRNNAIPVGSDFYLSPRHSRAGLVFIYDMMFLQSPDPEYRIRLERRVRDSVSAGHHVVTISQYCQKNISKHLDLTEDKISIVSPGVYLSQLELPKRISRERPMVLFIGEQSHRKNICAMLSAVKQLYDQGTDFEFLLVGKLTLDEPEIQHHLNRLGLSNDYRIRRLGWIAGLEKERLWQQADLFLFPSKDEGFGMPVIEAMARGVPVVTSDGGSLPEVTKDAALIVPLSSLQFVSDLADRIDMALSSNELRQRLVMAGKVRARLFSWESSVSQLKMALETMNG